VELVAAQKTMQAKPGIEQRPGQNNGDQEPVEREGVPDPAVEQRGERAGGAASGALQMEIRVDGALRVEVVLFRGEAQEQSRDARSQEASRRQPGLGRTAACGVEWSAALR